MSLQNQTISESPRFTGVPSGTERVEAAGGSLDGVLNGGGVRGKRSPKHEPTADGLPPESSSELADSQPPAKKKAKLVNEGETKEASATAGVGAADSEGASLLMVFADFAASSLPLAPGTANTSASATRSPPTQAAKAKLSAAAVAAPSLADVRFSAPPPFGSVALSTPTLALPASTPSTALSNALTSAPRATPPFPSLSASPTSHLPDLANGLHNAHFQVDPNGLSSPSEPKRKARKITPQLDPRVASASLASTGHSTVNIAGILGQQAAQAGSAAPPALPLLTPPTVPLALPLLKPNAINKPLGLPTDSLHTSPFAVKELKRCATHIKIAYHIVRVQHASGSLTKSSATPKLADASTINTPLQAPQGARAGETTSTASPAPPLTAVPRPSLHNVATPTISQPQPLMMAARPAAALSQSLGIDQQTFESLLALPPLHLQQLAQQGNPVALLVLQYQHQQQQQMGLLSAAANNPLLQQLYAQSMLTPGARTPNGQPNMNNSASVAHLQQLYLQQQQQYQMQMYQLQLLQQQAQLQQLHQQRVQQQQFQGLSNGSQNAINSLNVSAPAVSTVNALPNPAMTSSIAQTSLTAGKDATKQNPDETDTNSSKTETSAASGHALPSAASASSSAAPASTSNDMDISAPSSDAALQTLQSQSTSSASTLSSSRSSIPSIANTSVPLLPLASATLLTDTVHVKIEDSLPGHKAVPLPSPALTASSESNSSNSSTLNRSELNIKGETELFRTLTSALQASAGSALQSASDNPTTSNAAPTTIAATANAAPAVPNEASTSSSSSISQPQSIAS